MLSKMMNKNSVGLLRPAYSFATTKSKGKVMCCNRGEIATRIYRAAHELGYDSLGVYSDVDAKSLHRFKCTKAIQLNKEKSAVGQYLDIDNIIKIAKENGADILHPGYGFLAENAELATKAEKAGLKYAGPTGDVIDFFGDKVRAKKFAASKGIQCIPGSGGAIPNVEEAIKIANQFKYPVMIKAAAGGGGRGMRMARSDEELKENFQRAQSEALSSFGDDTVFLEKYIEEPRHIEVQILCDSKGNVVHLFERDCSVQRRHQKVIEIAPAVNLSEKVREELYRDAVHLAKEAKYRSAGTVEFLVDKHGNHFFMECNTRIQVEHTVSEEATGIDLVQAQIKIAEGKTLPELGLTQDKIKLLGAAVQLRVTTEDPKKAFQPDIGRIQQYSPGGGMGIRLDGNAFNGSEITPSYDSLLMKITGRGLTFDKACAKLIRELKEIKISGVKTNQPFLKNVLENQTFLNGKATTHFIDQNPQLFEFPAQTDETSKILNWLGNFVANPRPQFQGAATLTKAKSPVPLTMPEPEPPIPRGFRNIFLEEGPKGFAKAVNDHKAILYCDTTWRDAHQSLLMTRMRTKDLKNAATVTRHTHAKTHYSLEMWGGATFDVALRFLHECPWDRVTELRELVPNVPFQMLLRGANAVGYSSYADNVIDQFCKQAVTHGIDVFRIFDSLNYIDNMKFSMDCVGKAGGIIEAALCYTGIRRKYPLEYYLDFAKKLVDHGCHILCVKDMTGLLKPHEAKALVSSLKKEFPNTPLHIHTHDNAGAAVASLLACVESGADVIDVATDTMSAITSQGNQGTVTHILKGQPRSNNYQIENDYGLDQYWGSVRDVYAPFEGPQRSSFSDTYEHEMPGGQYTNLQFQAKTLGLATEWQRIKKTYVDANDALGDIIKVTPSSKVVGDLAQFMVQNKLDRAGLEAKAKDLAVPRSVLEFLQGYLGQPHEGYPEPLASDLLSAAGLKKFSSRPGDNIPPFDFEGTKKMLNEKYGNDLKIKDADLLSYALYPDVFEDFCKFRQKYGNITSLPTEYVLRPMEYNELLDVTLFDGSPVQIKLLAIGETNKKTGLKTVCFDVNGWFRSVDVKDDSIKAEIKENEIADTSKKGHVPSPLSSTIVDFKCKQGDQIKKGDVVVVLSAMKMEMVVKAPISGLIKRIPLKKSDNVLQGDLLIEIEEAK